MHIDFLPNNLGAFGRPGRGKGLVAAALSPAAARQERGTWRRSRRAEGAAGTCFERDFGETILNFDDGCGPEDLVQLPYKWLHHGLWMFMVHIIYLQL